MALKRDKQTYPQLPPAPEDYPVFPDTSTWPVVFPEIPAGTNGRFARPPQHTSKAVAPRIPADQVPNHVAVVMDGNGRWATQRGLGRTEGHKMGEAVLIDITCGAIELGIKVGDEWEVAGGLEGDEQVCLTKAATLKDGQPVDASPPQ